VVDNPRTAGSKGSSRKAAPTVITDAHVGASSEIASREKRYAITMAVRMACFVAMMFISGPFRWVLLAGAVFLPYVAVVLANQANTKTKTPGFQHYDPNPPPALTTGPVAPEVVILELPEDDVDGERGGDPEGNGARVHSGRDDGQVAKDWTRNRVA